MLRSNSCVVCRLEKALQTLTGIGRARDYWVLAQHRLRGSPAPPPHQIKQYWVCLFQRRYSLRTLVETGTFKGTMLRAVAGQFQEMYSIELSQHYYARAVEMFSCYEHVTLLHGDSGIELASVLRGVTNRCLFWLDAHYSEGTTARGDKETPILDELEAIRRHQRNDHVILIDDARCFDGDNGYPTLTELHETLKRINPRFTVRVVDDIVQAY